MSTPEKDLTADDRERIERGTRQRCTDLNTAYRHGTAPLIKEKQIDQAAELAVALYETAARYGVQPVDSDLVTNFITAAVDGIRVRDRRH